MTGLTSTVRREPPFSMAEESELIGELDRVLKSSWFRSSQRCSSLLRYAVEGALHGQTDRLRERQIAAEVFHRGPDYSSDIDPVVRVAASEVRKRLAQYYSAPENTGHIRIEVPVGSYVPNFHFPLPEDLGEKLPERGLLVSSLEEHKLDHEVAFVEIRQAPSSPLPQAPQSRGRAWLALTVVLILLAGAGVAWMRMRQAPYQSGFDSFWAPVLAARESPLISIGEFRTTQVKFAPNGERGPISKSWMLGENGTIPPGIKAVVFPNSFAATKIAMLLTRKNLQVELRAESDTDYAELCKRPAVLIGLCDNDWTLRLTNEMRFRFVIDFEQQSEWISDRDRPTDKIGPRSYFAYLPRTFEDYAIVARTINRSTGHPVIILGGLSPLGITGATEFVSNPKFLDDFARRAPLGWEHKNIEFLIACSSVDDVAGPPRIVAYNLW